MEDDNDFIPRSARLVEFEFRTSKMVEDSPAFQTIKADTIVLVKDFRLALKQQIMATLRIEIDLLKAEMYANLMKGLHICVTAHLISEQKRHNVHQIVSTIILHHFEELFEHTDMDKDDFYTYYKKEFDLPVFPIPNGTPTQDEPTAIDDKTVETPTATTLHRESLSCKFAILSTFTLPGRAYFKRTEDIEIELTLKKLHSDDSLEESTINTASRLNAETSVDTELLQSIIATEVATKTNKLNSELGQLKKKLSSLAPNSTPSNSAPVKSKRGRQKKAGGASSNKKKSQSKSPSSKPSNGRKKQGQQAGGHDNATSKKPRKQKKKPAKKKNGARK